ncbi:MAG: FkbM family methyltransferase [Alphaproteobacteria bacterium]|nr:FkbM family methyltransferase [Alphaproteobacteria bacterium]MCD8571460.1 FkbM family methyltransferase [Alphaproteobacteria bacterium]
MFFIGRSYLAYLFSLIPGAYKLSSALRFLSKCLANAEHYNQNRNGERRASANILSALSSSSPVVYDIGANMGEWSEGILQLSPEAAVHAFEMIPDFAERAAERLKPWPQAVLHPLGLSDHDQTMTAYRAGGGASITDHDFGTKEKVPVTIRAAKGDDYIAAQNLPAPGFIKIDVEGHELKVLHGLEQTISSARPFVQFEYGKHYINERIYLKDIYAFFEGLDYQIYQIFPTKLVKRKWSPALENFWTANFIAVPAEKAKSFS